MKLRVVDQLMSGWILVILGIRRDFEKLGEVISDLVVVRCVQI